MMESQDGVLRVTLSARQRSSPGTVIGAKAVHSPGRHLFRLAVATGGKPRGYSSGRVNRVSPTRRLCARGPANPVDLDPGRADRHAVAAPLTDASGRRAAPASPLVVRDHGRGLPADFDVQAGGNRGTPQGNEMNGLRIWALRCRMTNKLPLITLTCARLYISAAIAESRSIPYFSAKDSRRGSSTICRNRVVSISSITSMPASFSPAMISATCFALRSRW